MRKCVVRQQSQQQRQPKPHHHQKAIKIIVVMSNMCVRKIYLPSSGFSMGQVLREAVAMGMPRTRRPWKKILVVVEGIYSMEGEVADLAPIVKVAKKHKVCVRVCVCVCRGGAGGRYGKLGMLP